MDEVAYKICGKVVNWMVVKGVCTSFLTKELLIEMMIWHLFLCVMLSHTAHLIEVTRERALMLYAISKGLSINVGSWILANILHVVNNLTLGLLFPTLIIELVVVAGLDTSDQEVLQSKKPLN